MKRKFLEDLGLEKEAIDKILDENSADIGKAKGETKNLEDTIATLKSEKEALEKQVAERDSQLETLKNSTGDVEAMKKQIETLQADNKAAADKHAAEIKQLKIDNAVDSAITGAKGKNAKAIKALLNLEGAELADDNTIKGLAEQIEALQKSDAYLFEAKETKKQFKGAVPGESGNEDGNKAVDPSKMTYSELAAYMAENPDYKLD